MRILFILLLLTIYSLNTTAQDIIHKNDGRIIAAKVLKIDSALVHYKEITDLRGPTLTLPRSELDHIKFDYSLKQQTVVKNKLDYVRPKNAVALGLGGTGAMFSIFYDRAIFETPSFFVSGRLGFGSWLNQSNINAHLTGNYNFGKHHHYLEFGVSGAVALSDWNNVAGSFYKFYLNTPLIGYRLQSSSGLFFRTYLSAFFMIQDAFGNNFTTPMLGIDFGYCF